MVSICRLLTQFHGIDIPYIIAGRKAKNGIRKKRNPCIPPLFRMKYHFIVLLKNYTIHPWERRQNVSGHISISGEH